jgi:hypothetical protein
MTDGERDPLHQVQEYRKIVLLYEALDKQIDDLIMAHGGLMENMSPDDLARYRSLANSRDEMQNEMRLLEQALQIDDEL